MSFRSPSIEEHPDLVAMRARYDRAAARPTAQAVDGLTFLAGLYFAISPWVIGFAGATTLVVSNLIVGLAVAFLAVGFASAYGYTHGLMWVMPFLGAYMILSPWLAAGAVATQASVLSNLIAGGAVVLLFLGQIAMGTGESKRG